MSLELQEYSNESLLHYLIPIWKKKGSALDLNIMRYVGVGT